MFAEEYHETMCECERVIAMLTNIGWHLLETSLRISRSLSRLFENLEAAESGGGRPPICTSTGLNKLEYTLDVIAHHASFQKPANGRFLRAHTTSKKYMRSAEVWAQPEL